MTPLKRQLLGSTSPIVHDPASVGALILGANVGTSAIIFNITAQAIVGYIAISTVTSLALRALMPKQSLSSGMQGLLTNNLDGTAVQQYVYGQVRKGGTITFYESSGTNNKYLHMVVCLAGHKVAEIGDIYVNDEVVALDASGFVISSPWNSKIRIKKHLGSESQTADPDLVSETSVTNSFRGKGIAYLYIRLEYDQDVFPNGIPTFTAVVKGKEVYDPRTDTTAWSSNAALCVRDYLTDDRGLGDPSIDETLFAIAANICAEPVALSAGGSEMRYGANGVIVSDVQPGAALQQMITACAGTLFWGQGAWKLKPGYYTPPVKTFTLSDLRSAISLQTRQSMSEVFNAVQGTFNDAAQDWITADYPKLVGPAFVTEDHGVESAIDLELPMTTSAATAQRISKLALYRGREQMTFSADFGLSALEVQVGDIVAITNERYGWANKEFEVTGWKFFNDEDGMRVNMTLRETSEAAFDWDSEESAIIHNNASLPAFNVVASVTDLHLEATSVLNDDGISIPAIKATWTPSTNSFVQYYEIQYKRLGGEEDWGSIADAHTTEDDWGSVAAVHTTEDDWGLTNEPVLTPDVDYVSSFGSSNAYLIQPVLNGYDYNVRVRAVNSIGVRSPWATSTLSSIGDTTPPNEPLSLSAVGTYKSITLSWINPADQDLDFIEIWQSTVNNLASATLIGSVKGTNFTVPNLPNNTTRFYWVRAVDYSLNVSDFSSGASATTLLIEPNDFSDAVNDLFTEAGAFGVEPVNSLPASGDFDGQLVLLLPEITIYRWDSATSAWSTDIYTASSVEAGSLTYASFASGIEPVGVVSTLPTVSGYVGPSVVVLTTDGKLYRLVSGAWTAAIPTSDLTGTLNADLFSSDLRPIERVSSLPTTGLAQGRVVMLTTDNKLYRYTGSAWTAAVPATDLTGQITGTQITDNAITTSKIAANAVEAGQISAGAVTAAKIDAAAVSADKIAANAVTADKIGANAVVAGKIAAGAVNADQIATNAVTTDKLFASAVTTDKIATGNVVADKIAAGAIITSKIAAGAVTADKMTVSELSAISANLGAILVDSANIANLSVTNAKIDDLTIGTEKIQNLAVSNSGSVEVASYNVGSTSYAVAASFSFATAGSKPVLIQVAYDLEITASGGGENYRSVTFAFRLEGSIIKEWKHGGVGRSTGLSRMDMTTSIDASTPVELLVKHSSGAGGTETVSNITLVAVEYKK